MQIKPKFIKDGGFEGELSITDFAVFDENGLLGDVEKAWTATKELSLSLDRTHSDDLIRLDAHFLRLGEVIKQEPEAIEDFVMSKETLEVSRACHMVFVPAVIFILQISFIEFALKRVCCTLDSNFRPLPKGVIAGCTSYLKREKVIQQVPREFEDRISRKIEVRNDFAHGEWVALSTKLQEIDLFGVFEAVTMFLGVIKDGLQSKGFEV